MQSMDQKKRLRELHCFRTLSDEAIEELSQAGKVSVYSKNTTIIRAREKVSEIYFAISGKVIIYNLTRHGQRKIIFVLGPGVLINENVINSQYSSTFCDTIERCELFSVESAVFLRLLEKDFSLTRVIMEEQERKIWRMSHQLKNTMGSIYMERKLAAKLWKLGRDFGTSTEEGVRIEITMTITFLADLMGAPRETISRLCKILTGYGLMKMERRRIILPDIDRLALFYKEGVLVNASK